MLRKLLLWGSENDFFSDHVARLRFVRRAVRRFMPGETSAEAIEEVVRLSVSRIRSVLALLGENVTEADEADDVTRHYEAVLKEIGARDLDAEISVKPTQLGIDIGEDVVAANLERILSTAKEHGHFVWIDMEGSDYVDRTLDLYRAARSRHTDTGVCLQAYLYRTAEDLAALLPINPSVRLVKGAYAESTKVAFPRKRDVDQNYLQLAQTLLDEIGSGGVRAAFATHDGALIRRIQEEAAQRGMTPGDVEFQMLYGIGTTSQEKLAAQGHEVRVHISYGIAWFPWYMRRLAERPANLWFVMRKMMSR
ncbi:MAG: proline dehydrogenase family protein [Gemmatimonadota bacterium]|nr:proline dehydrogenase family protein [Gemmatimonadota bacterium]